MHEPVDLEGLAAAIEALSGGGGLAVRLSVRGRPAPREPRVARIVAEQIRQREQELEREECSDEQMDATAHLLARKLRPGLGLRGYHDP